MFVCSSSPDGHLESVEDGADEGGLGAGCEGALEAPVLGETLAHPRHVLGLHPRPAPPRQPVVGLEAGHDDRVLTVPVPEVERC